MRLYSDRMLVNSYLERTWKDAVLLSLKYQLFLEGLKRSVKDNGKDRRPGFSQLC